MRRLICALALASGVCGAFAGTKDEEMLKGMLPGIFAKCEDQYRKLEADALKERVDSKGVYHTPHSFDAKKGKIAMYPVTWWTSGHFPGSLWYLYEATGKDEWLKRAVEWTGSQASVAEFTGNHDIGFMMYCSMGNGKRLSEANRADYEALLVKSARTLCKRFHEGLGLIRSWGKADDEKSFLVIPDNMMNLELLMWASKQKVEDAAYFRRVAMSHADVSMKNHFRADGGTYHVLNYDQKSGRVLEIYRGQGASCLTAWSRGQAWAIYGFSMMYRLSGEKRYLDFARKLADFAISHPNMPSDGVPYWDFGAPGEERDTSAAAIMASGLLELAGFVTGEAGEAYRAFAVKSLLSLASSRYFAAPGANGGFLITQGVEHKPIGRFVNAPLDYTDYYFLEALLRFRNHR